MLQVMLRHLALELDAVTAVSGHGFTSECSQSLSILTSRTVHSQGRTPSGNLKLHTLLEGGDGLRPTMLANPTARERGADARMGDEDVAEAL